MAAKLLASGSTGQIYVEMQISCRHVCCCRLPPWSVSRKRTCTASHLSRGGISIPICVHVACISVARRRRPSPAVPGWPCSACYRGYCGTATVLRWTALLKMLQLTALS